jgi:hypothetical protein
MFENLFRKAKEVFVDPTADIQRVNCLNLVPATIQVPRLHCDMGDGRTGDCLVYLKKAKTHECKSRELKYVPLSKEGIEAKVYTKLKDQMYLKKCLDVCICPECGHDLEVIFDDDHGLDDGHCPICQKRWPI